MVLGSEGVILVLFIKFKEDAVGRYDNRVW